MNNQIATASTKSMKIQAIINPAVVFGLSIIVVIMVKDRAARIRRLAGP